MAPAGQGRFCAHCSETVIDFTNYSDSALYNFFAKNNSEHVCGRFLGTQLDRNIHIPPQPHSQLYRLTVAFGLTLLFTQTPQLLAQTRPPKTAQNIPAKKTDNPNTWGELCGHVTTHNSAIATDVVVQVYQDGISKGGAVTDLEGNYVIKALTPGTYDIIAHYAYYDSTIKKAIVVKAGETTTFDFQMYRLQKSFIKVNPDKTIKMDGLILSPIEDLIQLSIDSSSATHKNNDKIKLDMEPTKRTYTREEINNSPK